MPIHQLTLLAREAIARDTIQLTFKKPDGFQFKPGQYGGFTLTHVQLDPANTTRRFSIASAPYENDIVVTTRMQTSAYKRALNELPLGGTVKFAGPIGNFVLHDDKTQPAVFIAGGIGLTPFYSMIKDALNNHSQQAITLFYGNQSEEDAAYLHELTSWSKTHPNFKLIPVMMQTDNSTYETGYISYAIIKKHVSDLTTPFYYICGSPLMVKALHETLNELDIPDDRIKMEDFPGY